ncbi:hypothetical protein LR48_Vigan07g171200 [Vigna angularis]|uniref:Uncharacterized protein n=1 Tax=Phaseolus angularis TaxID=3914 RepID=A0A0L9UZ20_PHAAN|nr:hypothetical protein LR48_Vigan07g171200 [Vigna angularis]
MADLGRHYCCCIGEFGLCVELLLPLGVDADLRKSTQKLGFTARRSEERSDGSCLSTEVAHVLEKMTGEEEDDRSCHVERIEWPEKNKEVEEIVTVR